MKNHVLFFALLLTTGLFVACNNTPEGQAVQAEEALPETGETAAQEGTVFLVNTEASRILWEGAKPTRKHNGAIRLKDGSLLVNEGKIVGGSFTIDMNSIEVLDLEGDRQAKLASHLTSGDFFETEKFPTGRFEIVSVSTLEAGEGAVNIKGNLTMRDITKSIEFPAIVMVTENRVMAKTPRFTINRTEWGVNYDSGILGTAKDAAINDNIGLEIELEAALAEQ